MRPVETARGYPFREPVGLALEPEYAELREREPVSRIRLPYGGEAWLAVRHEDVRLVLSDPRFSRAALLDRDVPRTSPRRLTDPTLHTMDPPEHNRLRRLVAAAFSPRQIDLLTEHAQHVTDDLLDRIEDAGPPADLVAGLAVPLPIAVICHMLGVPAGDRDQFTEWIDVALATTAFTPEEIHEAFTRLKDYVAELVAVRRDQVSRGESTGDLLGALVAARDTEGRLSENELVVLGVTLLYAGLETTSNHIGNFTYVLLTHPDQLAALRADPGLIDPAVDELLRFTPTVTSAGFTRIAVVDVELGGVLVRAGDAVMVNLDAANRDDRVFADPDRLDLTRKPNPHLAFGFGPHYCVAAQLAKAELRVAIGTLLRRFPRSAGGGRGAVLAARPHGARPGPAARDLVTASPRVGGRVLTGSQFALLGFGLLVNIGTFAVYPYLAVLLRERLGAGMAEVGVVLGAATLVQFASAPFTAVFAERVGLKRTLLLATFVYGLGAVTYLAGSGNPGLTVFALFLSCGAGALYSPAYRGYLTHSATAEQRPRLVSSGNSASNLGIALGPVVGALFLHESDRLFAVTTVLYAVLAVGHLFLRPERPIEHGPGIEPFWRVLRGLAVTPFAVTVCTHYLYMQFYQYLSVFTEGRLPTTVYGAIMMGYSLGLVVAQPLAARWVGRIRYPLAMVVGFSCMALGMAAFTGGTPVTVAAGAVAMSVGTAVLFLKNDLEALAGSRRSATVTFGQQRLAAGVGSLLSGVVGGTVYGWFEQADRLPGFWLAVAAQCVLLPPLVLVVRRVSRRR